MTDYKRSISQVGDAVSTHDDKKLHTKPGRKPIDTEPKSKRTAQNRAAQRAYRERKERKMKDLETKVSLLEDLNIKALEKIELLKSELRRHRGHSDLSDLNLPQTPEALRTSGESEAREKQEEVMKREDSEEVQPWSSNASNTSLLPSDSSGTHVPDLVSGSSSSTTPLNDHVLVSPDSTHSDNYHLPVDVDSQLTSQAKGNLFEEEPNPFCASLSEACGTKEKPQPKFQRDTHDDLSQSYHSDNFLRNVSIESPFGDLSVPNTDLPDPFFNTLDFANTFPSGADNTDLSKYVNDLNEDKFDLSLALGKQAYDPVTEGNQQNTLDPLMGLVNEDSVYDPLNLVNTNFNFNEFVKSSYSTSESSRTNSVVGGPKTLSSMTSFDSPRVLEEVEEDGKNEIVPAPEKTLKCTEIWDRVTSHPKYADIDIDGLCDELKQKAKCSEKGVVLSASDVHHLLEKSATGRL